MFRNSLSILLLLVSECNAAYTYTREAVMQLGGNCLDSTNLDNSHTIISDIDNPKRSRSHTVTLDLDPGMMCWFETFNDFKISSDPLVNSDIEIENLSVFYFPYEG